MKMVDTGKRFYEARTKWNRHTQNGEKEESIRKVSDETGVPASSLSNYENKGRLPETKNAQILADYYGVNVLWLLGKSESRSIDENSQVVTKITGLSTDAVKNLQIMQEKGLIESLNTLLESQDFMRMVKDFNTARIINKKSTETEKEAELIDGLTQWGTDRGMDRSGRRMSDHTYIDSCLWKASQEIGIAFREILKGDKNNG